MDYERECSSLYRCIVKEDWDAALLNVTMNPLEARTWVIRRDPPGSGKVVWRFLPLHSACARNPPAQFIAALLEAYPEAAPSKDAFGM